MAPGPRSPGQEWGTEVPLGQGDVGMENYLRTLVEIGYTGPLTIEREIPQEPEPAESRDRPRRAAAHGIEEKTAAKMNEGVPMPKLTVSVPHALGQEAATKQLQGILEKMKEALPEPVQRPYRRLAGERAELRLQDVRLSDQGDDGRSALGSEGGRRPAVCGDDVKGRIEQELKTTLARWLT